MMVYGIDPGPEKSGWFLWDSSNRRGLSCGWDTNQEILDTMIALRGSNVAVACEKIVSYGMPVGENVFQTCIWIGRFLQALWPNPFYQIPNAAVRGYLCRSSKARDVNVRAALIEKHGPVGVKKNPGPFYGCSGHMWSAAAVAVTFAECETRRGEWT